MKAYSRVYWKSKNALGKWVKQTGDPMNDVKKIKIIDGKKSKYVKAEAVVCTWIEYPTSWQSHFKPVWSYDKVNK